MIDKDEYKTIREVNDGIVYIGEVSMIIGVYKIGFNTNDLYIDCFDKNDELIGSVYYKKTQSLIYCEVFSTDETIILAEKGKIINKEW